jgi:hypothetical protein
VVVVVVIVDPYVGFGGFIAKQSLLLFGNFNIERFHMEIIKRNSVAGNKKATRRWLSCAALQT